MKNPRVYTGTKGLFAAAYPVSGLTNLLRILTPMLQREGITIQDTEQMHCTLMYSPNHAPRVQEVYNHTIRFPFQMEAWVECADWWEGHDGDGYLGLKLKSQDLITRHEAYKALGCVSTFPDFMPHVTLASKISAPKCLPAINTLLKNVQYRILFDAEQVEDMR